MFFLRHEGRIFKVIKHLKGFKDLKSNQQRHQHKAIDYTATCTALLHERLNGGSSAGQL